MLPKQHHKPNKKELHQLSVHEAKRLPTVFICAVSCMINHNTSRAINHVQVSNTHTEVVEVVPTRNEGI